MPPTRKTRKRQQKNYKTANKTANKKRRGGSGKPQKPLGPPLPPSFPFDIDVPAVHFPFSPPPPPPPPIDTELRMFRPKKGISILDPNVILQHIHTQFSGVEDIAPIAIDDKTDTYTIEDEQYNIKKQLGRGAFGTVFLLERQEPPSPSQKQAKLTAESSPSEPAKKAIKEINLTKLIRASIAKHQALTPNENIIRQIKHIANEIRLLKQIKQFCEEYFVCYEHIYYRINPNQDIIIYIATEYLYGFDLYDFAKKYTTMGNPVKMTIVHRICNAVANLHQLGIVHRDIKPENIYVIIKPGNKFRIKIIDFGLGDAISESKSYKYAGTPIFSLPEVNFLECNDYKKVVASDLWAVGLIALMLVDYDTYYYITEYISDMKANKITNEITKQRLTSTDKIYEAYSYVYDMLISEESESKSIYDSFIQETKRVRLLTVDLRTFMLAALDGLDDNLRLEYDNLLQKPEGWTPSIRRRPAPEPTQASDSSASASSSGGDPEQDTCNKRESQYVMTSSGKVYDFYKDIIPKSEMTKTLYPI